MQRRQRPFPEGLGLQQVTGCLEYVSRPQGGRGEQRSDAIIALLPALEAVRGIGLLLRNSMVIGDHVGGGGREEVGRNDTFFDAMH